MSELPFTALQAITERFANNNAFRALIDEIVDAPGMSHDQLTSLYDSATDLIETELWSSRLLDTHLLELYQQLFREQEAAIATAPAVDTRHYFTIVIPVADRPRHLECCLNSLLELCCRYEYGGRDAQGFRRLSVLIADDSRDKENIRQNEQLAEQFSQQGLHTEHFNQSQQFKLLQSIPAKQRAQLNPLLGTRPAEEFGHKGASIMRNISYLKLAGSRIPNESRLFYFVDSDQEFRIPVDTPDGTQQLYTINYLHHLDRIFRDGKTQVLTGKVVGDPPVSPAVMVVNLLDDVIDFFRQISELPPRGGCTFHQALTESAESTSAAYHDMPDLFGFRHQATPSPYPCPLNGEHDHQACLNEFSSRLARFFDGEHPTRKTRYIHQSPMQSLQPARTIYTGNYILSADALRYFIPFAELKLRMAGPTLGRIIQSSTGNAFCSANLPMLHRRTVEEIGQSEFRPGIEREDERVDLSDEFERQFFGDLMLFSIEQLTNSGFPEQLPDTTTLEQTLDKMEAKLLDQYNQKHQALIERVQLLQQLVNDPANWWNQCEESAAARQQIALFIDNITFNFGDAARGYGLIKSAQNRQQQREKISAAILSYPDLCSSWNSLINPSVTTHP